MLEIKFENSDQLLHGKQVLRNNGFTCGEGANYRSVRIEADDGDIKTVTKMLKKEKIKCSVSRV